MGGAAGQARERPPIKAVSVVGLDDESLFGRPELEQGNISGTSMPKNTFFVVDDAEFSETGEKTEDFGTSFGTQ